MSESRGEQSCDCKRPQNKLNTRPAREKLGMRQRWCAGCVCHSIIDLWGDEELWWNIPMFCQEGSVARTSDRSEAGQYAIEHH